MLQCPTAIQHELDRLHLSCLALQWRTRKSVYRFRCQHGHEFDYLADSLAALKQCPVCRNAIKLERLLAKAAHEGSECLDGWLGSRAQYRFRCLNEPSHQWTRAYPSALHSARCPHCSIEKAAQNKLIVDGLQRLQAYAQSRGGECLSTIYMGGERMHQFRCAQGHTWNTRAGRMARLKQWCPQCRNDRQRHDLDRVRACAAARGGRFLSDTYQNNRTPYEWSCALGHTWTTTYASIRTGTWCHQCACDEQRLDLLTLQRAAQSHGGACLSDTYINTKTPYQWQCRKGHTWKALYEGIRKGHWCRRCHTDSTRLTLEDLHQTARERGGLCLSTQYETSKAYYLWQCERGHTWRAVLGRVRHGTWCPVCFRISRTKPGSAAWRRYQTHQPRD